MPATLSEKERAAIEAFERKKGVTKCPPAGTPRPAPYAWDAGKKNLVSVDPEAARSTTWSRRSGGIAPHVAQRRLKVRELAFQGKTGQQIADLLGVSVNVIYSDVKAAGITLLGKRKQAEASASAAPKAKPEATPPAATQATKPQSETTPKTLSPAEGRAAEIKRRRERVADMAGQRFSGDEIAQELGVSRATIGNDLKALGVTLNPDISRLRSGEAPRGATPVASETPSPEPKRRSGDKAAAKKEASNNRALPKVKDRRRFKTVPVPIGDYGRLADPRATGTKYPDRVLDPVETEHVLKDGSVNAKIGGDVLVGWLKGARIFTLTLEERATCPRHCVHWSGCYGNSMQYARRWRHGPALLEAIRLELMDLCATHERVLIRLHVLGDFWSVDYVRFWGKQLKAHPGLHLFGFTAHKRESEIGRELAKISTKYRDRVWMRQSEMTGPMGSFTLDFPTERKTIGDAVVCPEQRDAMAGARRGTHCGNCGVCWSSDRPIAFVVH